MLSVGGSAEDLVRLRGFEPGSACSVWNVDRDEKIRKRAGRKESKVRNWGGKKGERRREAKLQRGKEGEKGKDIVKRVLLQ